MRNLKASPRVPFPQLPFSFGDKPVRQTTRRLRWGAVGGWRPGRVTWACRSVAGHTLPVPLPPGGVAERPCLWKPPDARAAGDPLVRRPRPSLPPTAPAPYSPRQPRNRPPHESSRRGASVSRLSPGPGHSTRSRGSSWRAGGLGGAPASSSPTRSARGGCPAPRTWAASDGRHVPSALTHRWDEGRRGLGAAPEPGPALASFRLSQRTAHLEAESLPCRAGRQPRRELPHPRGWSPRVRAPRVSAILGHVCSAGCHCTRHVSP